MLVYGLLMKCSLELYIWIIGWMIEEYGLDSQYEQENFSFSHKTQAISGVHSAFFPTGISALFLRAKQPQCAAGH